MYNIGIIGYRHYGMLAHKLLRRFALDVNVLVNEKTIEPDGGLFVALDGLKKCHAVIFAVDMASFEGAVRDLLNVEGLNEDMVLVNVCSDQTKSGETLRSLAGNHPYISLHTPWGPEAYRQMNEVVSLLPTTIVTDTNLGTAQTALFARFLECGFRYTIMSAEEHDTILAGKFMFISHWFTQQLDELGLLDGDSTFAPISFQKIKEGALLLQNDKPLLPDLWNRVPACHDTFTEVMRITHKLEQEKIAHANGK